MSSVGPDRATQVNQSGQGNQGSQSSEGMHVVVVTGRRIDAPESAVARFPSAHVPAVRAKLTALFQRLGAQALVASAACGTDLIALDVARNLGIQAHVVLPFDSERFRETSVVDRGGDWGPLFDSLMDTAERQGRLQVLPEATGSNHNAYVDAVTALLDTAATLSQFTPAGETATAPGPVAAVAVWEGKPRGDGDVTAYFIAEARKRGFAPHTLST